MFLTTYVAFRSDLLAPPLRRPDGAVLLSMSMAQTNIEPSPSLDSVIEVASAQRGPAADIISLSKPAACQQGSPGACASESSVVAADELASAAAAAAGSDCATSMLQNSPISVTCSAPPPPAGAPSNDGSVSKAPPLPPPTAVTTPTRSPPGALDSRARACSVSCSIVPPVFSPRRRVLSEAALVIDSNILRCPAASPPLACPTDRDRSWTCARAPISC